LKQRAGDNENGYELVAGWNDSLKLKLLLLLLVQNKLWIRMNNVFNNSSA
jgi:hypothetical protein